MSLINVYSGLQGRVIYSVGKLESDYDKSHKTNQYIF